MNGPKRTGALVVTCALGFGVWAPQAVAAPEQVSGRTQAQDLTQAAVANRAGPELLYAGPAKAPQLQNTGIWRAAPVGVCMASAYRAGEYVHQGCVYDDQGGGIQYRWFYDTIFRNYTYPDGEAYRRNAADILEVRVKPLKKATAFRSP